jgi:L-aminopeptidase/D-esterase-like protein
VVLCEAGAVAAAAVLGGAPGTRETDLLRLGTVVDRVHAILLTGGSAFGLAAADGVVRVLEHRGIGFATAAARIPIVPAAVLYDLSIGDAAVRPGVEMGEAACRAAGAGPVEEGNAGAGTGATVGKLLGAKSRMKAGVGTWSLQLRTGTRVGALVATNAFGDVVDPRTGAIVAGARDPKTGAFLGTAAHLVDGMAGDRHPFEHTTIGVVATNAPLTRADAARLAVAAHTGLARAVSPSHTSVDGDTFFVLGTGGATPSPGPLDAPLTLEAAVASVVVHAVLRSVRLARSAGGVPGLAG